MLTWDHATYKPNNRHLDDAPSPGLFVFLAGALAGSLIAAPFWILIFELVLGRR